MKIHFGLELDDLVFPKSKSTVGNVQHFGPQGLLLMLETHLGQAGHPNNNEHLRIEQFRQALQIHLRDTPHCFFQKSFAADQLATAATLLGMRDELVLGNWNFQADLMTPPRLLTLASVENIFKSTDNTLRLAAGFADRFRVVIQRIKTHQQPIEKIILNEPLEYLPQHFQDLFRTLQSEGASIEDAVPFEISTKHDLSIFQKVLNKETSVKEKQQLQNDGSLLLVKSKRETHAAAWLANFFLKNEAFRPLCLIPEKSRALDNAFIQEGMPSLGILSASLARPSLQILKLVTTFLWQPIDPYKILEFVSLTVKPLADDLAHQIAMLMAQTPGVKSDRWYAITQQYFRDLEETAKADRSVDFNKIKNQYDFWFERTRYRINQKVPIADAIQIFEYLARWASEEFENSNGKNTSMLILSEQAKRVKDLLEAQPETETQLTNLELERIVRTIYEPSPTQFRETEIGHLPFVHQSSAIIKNVDELLWWNFSSNEPDYFFSQWYGSELNYLKNLNIHLQSPTDKNKLLIWQRSRPVLRTKDRLILIMPEMVNGSEVFPHPLHDVLEATFENLSDITFDVDNEAGKAAIQRYFQTPEKVLLQNQPLGQSQPFIQIGDSRQLLPDYESEDGRNYETFTSLILCRKTHW